MTEEGFALRSLLDDDLDVVEPASEMFGKRFERISDKPFETLSAAEALTYGGKPRPAELTTRNLGCSP
jgi:hypothetical protein